MGDRSTHLIFFSGYWYLVFQKDDKWVQSDDGIYVCAIGKEEVSQDLSKLRKAGRK